MFSEGGEVREPRVCAGDMFPSVPCLRIPHLDFFPVWETPLRGLCPLSAPSLPSPWGSGRAGCCGRRKRGWEPLPGRVSPRQPLSGRCFPVPDGWASEQTGGSERCSLAWTLGFLSPPACLPRGRRSARDLSVRPGWEMTPGLRAPLLLLLLLLGAPAAARGAQLGVCAGSGRDTFSPAPSCPVDVGLCGSGRAGSAWVCVCVKRAAAPPVTQGGVPQSSVRPSVPSLSRWTRRLQLLRQPGLAGVRWGQRLRGGSSVGEGTGEDPWSLDRWLALPPE